MQQYYNNVNRMIRQSQVILFPIYFHRTPSLSENGWRQLLNDIITLRNRVFKTLDQNLCYKVTFHMYIHMYMNIHMYMYMYIHVQWNLSNQDLRFKETRGSVQRTQFLVDNVHVHTRTCTPP